MLCDNESITDRREFDILLDVADTHDHMPQNTEFEAWLLSSGFRQIAIFRRIVYFDLDFQRNVSTNRDNRRIVLSTNRDFRWIVYCDESRFSAKTVEFW